jgi:hypothetical protein
VDGLFLFAGVTAFVLVAGAALSWVSWVRRSGRSLTAPTTTDVTVIDAKQLSQAVSSLLGPGSIPRTLKLIDPNSSAWSQLRTTIKGYQPGPDSPFGVVAQVRAALLAHQLDSVRHLLSDRVYQRLSASLPMPAAEVPDRLIMITLEKTGEDPNRRVVRVGGSVAMPGAKAEDWTLVRALKGPIAAPALPAATAQTIAVPSPTCSLCGAQVETGATRCPYCGMDLTQAPPNPEPMTPEPAPGEQTWIVEDISAANPLAA